VAEVVADRIPVLLDGGVRRGTDIAKALALGARAVLVGRPVLWGLAHAGRAGVSAVLRCLLDELQDALVLSGHPNPGGLTPEAVTPWPPDTRGGPGAWAEGPRR
jgi:4-hydroxymandelate oxidase